MAKNKSSEIYISCFQHIVVLTNRKNKIAAHQLQLGFHCAESNSKINREFNHQESIASNCPSTTKVNHKVVRYEIMLLENEENTNRRCKEYLKTYIQCRKIKKHLKKHVDEDELGYPIIQSEFE